MSDTTTIHLYRHGECLINADNGRVSFLYSWFDEYADRKILIHPTQASALAAVEWQECASMLRAELERLLDVVCSEDRKSIEAVLKK